MKKMATLKKFTTIDPSERLSFSLKLSTRRGIEEYRQLYQSGYGHPVERGALIEQLLVAWFDQDAEFARFRKGMSAEQRAAVETALGGQAGEA